MYIFINLLKVIATILITNAHYESIYPVSIIANGGLLGDVIFFAVSGFCLTNIKENFGKWYSKRIIRIYPTVFIVTLIYIICGYYLFDFNISNFVTFFIFPTKYHFVSSIMILYIVYYLIMYIIKKFNISKQKGIKIALIIIIALYFLYYLIFFDKSFYHIDSVYEWNIRFFFLICMLLGAWIRENMNLYRNSGKIINLLIILVFAIIYFASKLIFVKYPYLSTMQIINQVILFVLLYFVFTTLLGYEDKLSLLSNRVKDVIRYISSLTLEIYLIQYLVINRLNIFSFPINFLVVSVSILMISIIIKSVIKIFIRQISMIRGVKK